MYNKAKGLLFIQDSQFLSNMVPTNNEVQVDIVVHIFTGSSELTYLLEQQNLQLIDLPGCLRWCWRQYFANLED